MALSTPRQLFGLCTVSPYKRTDGTFYGMLQVLEGSSLSLSAEMIDSQGGSNKFSWASEVGSIAAEMTLNFSEFPNFVFELFAGNAPTENSAEATGSATAIANKNGTSVVAATGILTTSLKSSSDADLKFGHYTVVAADATTVDVYFSSTVDINRGANGTMQNDALKITASPLTIAMGAAVDVPNFGLELTGGAGTIALVAGDSATFTVRPNNTASMDVTVGQMADQSFPEFGAIIMANKRSSGELFEIDALRCIGAGLPIGLARNAWSVAEVNVKLLYDQALDGVYKIRHVTPSLA